MSYCHTVLVSNEINHRKSHTTKFISLYIITAISNKDFTILGNTNSEKLFAREHDSTWLLHVSTFYNNASWAWMIIDEDKCIIAFPMVLELFLRHVNS